MLTVLAARGVDVPEPTRNRIAGCVDLDQLDLWLRRAVTAETVDDLFGSAGCAPQPPGQSTTAAVAAATSRRLCGSAPSKPGVVIVMITVSSRGLLTNLVEKNPCQLYAPGPPR